MLNRMYHFDVPGIPRTENQRELLDFWKATGESKNLVTLTNTQVAKWWCGHVLHIREYVKEYLSHSLIELDLYNTNGTESLLYDLIQVDTNRHKTKHQHLHKRQRCFWGHSNKNQKIVPPTRR